MRVFDWGDAVVGQPFGTLLVTLRVVAHWTGLPNGAPELLRLRDAYLEPWTDGWDRATLVEACRLALRVGGVLRSDCYRRALLEATPAGRAEFGDGVPQWLLEGEPADPAGTGGHTRAVTAQADAATSNGGSGSSCAHRAARLVRASGSSPAT